MYHDNPLFDDGTRLFRHADYQRYYRSTNLQRIIDAIHTQPGYHLIESGVGTGKTALIGHLYTAQRDPSSVVTCYLFSRDYRRTSIQAALESLRQQVFTFVAAPSLSIPENHLLNRVIVYAAGKVSHLLILLDGLDECNTQERKLLHSLLPDELPHNVTFVVTTRPLAKEIILRHLPARHGLRTVAALPLVPFDYHDIHGFLTTRFYIFDDQGKIAQRILDLSNGNPFFIHELCKSVLETVQSRGDPHRVLDTLLPLPTMQAVWERSLRDMQERWGGEQQPRLIRLLTLLAVAKSGLAFRDLTELLQCAVEPLKSLLDELDRYIFFQSAQEMTLFHKQFMQYVVEHHVYQLEVQQAEKQLSTWVHSYVRNNGFVGISPQELRQILTQAFSKSELRTLCFDMRIEYENLSGSSKADKARELVQFCQRYDRYDELVQTCEKLRPTAFAQLREHPPSSVSYPVQDTPDLQNVPLYVLRHAAEYLAPTPELRHLFRRGDWFTELQWRTKSRAECQQAVQRAWAVVEQLTSKTPRQRQIQVVNLIACALMTTAFTATLLPELVLAVVEVKLQPPQWAQAYANLYILPDDRATVLAGLTDPTNQPRIPADPEATQAYLELRDIRQLAPPAQAEAFADWLEEWERYWASTGNVDVVLEALAPTAERTSESQLTHNVSVQEVHTILAELQQYTLPPTDIMSPDYEQVLSRLTETWIRLGKRNRPRYLAPILRVIARASRAHLLEALAILAPALHTIFPEAIDDIRQVVKDIG